MTGATSTIIPKLSLMTLEDQVTSPEKYGRWTIPQIETTIRDKIQERTKVAGNFVYQQAYRLLEWNPGKGIDRSSFKTTLHVKFGIELNEDEVEELFKKYDTDGNGKIDIYEFINQVLPKEFGEHTTNWMEDSLKRSEEMRIKSLAIDRENFLSGRRFSIELPGSPRQTYLTKDDIRIAIQTKLLQRTKKSVDQFRKAYRMLQCGNDKTITMIDMRQNLKDKFGIILSEPQMMEFFKDFQKDGLGNIDLQSFLHFVIPSDDGENNKSPFGIWASQIADVNAKPRKMKKISPRIPGKYDPANRKREPWRFMHRRHKGISEEKLSRLSKPKTINRRYVKPKPEGSGQNDDIPILVRLPMNTNTKTPRIMSADVKPQMKPSIKEFTSKEIAEIISLQDLPHKLSTSGIDSDLPSIKAHESSDISGTPLLPHCTTNTIEPRKPSRPKTANILLSHSTCVEQPRIVNIHEKQYNEKPFRFSKNSKKQHEEAFLKML